MLGRSSLLSVLALAGGLLGVGPRERFQRVPSPSLRGSPSGHRGGHGNRHAQRAAAKKRAVRLHRARSRGRA